MIHGWFGVQGRPYVFAAVTLPRLGFTRRVRLLVDTSETTGIGGISELQPEARFTSEAAFNFGRACT